MLKNIIIITQLIVISLGLVFFVQYKKIVEQTHIVAGIGYLANETRYLHKINVKMANGEFVNLQEETEKLEKDNLKEIESLVAELDLKNISGEKNLELARRYAAILHEVGMYRISTLIEERAKKLDEPNN